MAIGERKICKHGIKVGKGKRCNKCFMEFIRTHPIAKGTDLENYEERKTTKYWNPYRKMKKVL